MTIVLSGKIKDVMDTLNAGMNVWKGRTIYSIMKNTNATTKYIKATEGSCEIINKE